MLKFFVLRTKEIALNSAKFEAVYCMCNQCEQIQILQYAGTEYDLLKSSKINQEDIFYSTNIIISFLQSTSGEKKGNSTKVQKQSFFQIRYVFDVNAYEFIHKLKKILRKKSILFSFLVSPLFTIE